MYLKSIEVHGFKAFANKIRFEFDKGITGIVGPNGSGKSNVADAVRWVLGEQSAKQLRGSSMQDVIFAGTETRKPLGFAYVALTLDNSDHWLPIEYDEVTVGRRVYRSGESEYLINGAECRLRDVQELFFDTGVGKEGYSIIGQGQIDKILSGKPEERREIFDEAAGITKVKRRKHQTEKNLEIERQNLSRVTDILTEIEGRLGPLEKQYEKARVYLRYKDELKTMEVNQFLLEYEKSATVKQELDDKLRIASDDLQQTKQEYEQAKEEYDRLLNELEQHQAALQTAREQHSEQKVLAEKILGETNLLKEQVTVLGQNEQQYEERLHRLEQQVEERRESLEQYEERQKEYDAKLQELLEEQQKAEAYLGEMKAELATMLSEEQACNQAYIERLQENNKQENELERYNTLLEQQNIVKAELNAKLLRFKTDADEAEKQISQANEALKDASGAVADAADECAEIEKTLAQLAETIAEKKEQCDKKQAQVIHNASRMETLKNLVERYDGYGSAVRKVMEQKNRIAGIHGVVADIIQVETKYQVAIETALGGNIQNVVTDTQETAKRLIQYLKDNHAGRATFIPLSGIRAKKDDFDSKVFTSKGVIGIASSLVKAEDIYDEAVRYLLGRFLVVDTIDNAISLEKQYKYALRIVTLDGELFQPGGAISGGAFKNSSNLLGKRREVEELEERLEADRKAAKAAEEELESLRGQREEYRGRLELRKRELQELYVKQNTAKLNLNHITEQNRDLVGNREQLREELHNAEASGAEIRTRMEELKALIRENDEKNVADKQRAQELRTRMEEMRGAEDEASAEAVRVLTEYSGLKQSVAYQKDNGNRLLREIGELGKEIEELREGRRDSEGEMQEKTQRIIQQEEQYCHIQKTCQELEAGIAGLSEMAEDITKQNKSFFEKREHLSGRMSQLDKEVYRLQSQREKLEEQLEAQTKYMWDEYELTYTSATQFRSPEIDNPTLNRKQIYELKSKIRGLGDVNVNAIEDYRETKERYEFLNNQRNDIQNAEQSLSQIISALDEEMRKQFNETFAKIQERFDKVFRELFGGGKGTLSLTEGEDVLEAGIHVIAQPPGKKLQNMMQLSGGEKALTAISLLFAILDLKPSPFCLLDEIEAALDDSNVSRFAQYLHKLTKDTQFIVITHRRGTMAAADALYGITMQEKGVSTLVSVNLIEKDLEQ